MHGLNTNPNLSFMHQLKLPAGYRFRNKRPAAPQRKQPAQVYVTLVQTDGLGLGAW